MEEFGDKRNALLTGAVLLQQEVAEVLFEAIDSIQGGMLLQVGLQLGLLLRLEIAAMTAHEGD